MRAWERIALLVAILLLVFSLGQGVADFGGYSGDTDYGGSDSGSSYSSGDSGFSWGSSSNDYGSGGSGGSFNPVAMTIALVVVVVIIYASSKKKGERSTDSAPGRSRQTPPGGTPSSAGRLLPISELIKADPNFSEAAMRERISELYVRFQKAWQQKDLASVRPYLSERFYAQLSRQLQDDYVLKHRTSYLEKIAVLEVQIRGYQGSDQDELTAYLRTRFVNYTRDDDTGAIVAGSTSQEVFMEYEWTLVRNKGVLTRPDGNAPDENCPNCGAVIDLSLSSKCAYCGTVLDTAEKDWVVSGIKGLSQRGRQ